MKNSFLLLLLLFAAIYTDILPQIQTNSRSQYCYQNKIHSQNGVQPGNIEANIIHSYNAINYELNIDIYNNFLSPYPKSFKGYEILTFEVDSTLNSIKLNAVNTSLQIDSVDMAGVSFTHVNNILTITLDRTYNVGEIADVKIYYQHKNVADNVVYISSGFFFTDCEPEGARKWFPCWDKPSDKATLDLTVRVPATVKLGSNGRLEDSIKTADTIYYNWVSRDNIATYLFVISGKVNYNLDIVYWHKLSNPNDSIPLRFYWNQGENHSSVLQMEEATLEMTDQYSTLFGEHPFEKNGFATLNSSFPWGGMENQTLTSLCPGCWSEGLISHEYAHQWFGDMITCATWADIWLNEGFATYSEALWIEHTSGYSSYKNTINGDADYYLSSNPGWAISEPDWAINTPPNDILFNYAITYVKGACVLHMLRYVMGDDKFFDGIMNYATDPNLKYHSAVTSDLKDDMSTVYGEDLSWFFDEWIFEPNHPVYANGYWIQSTGANAWEVGFQAKQTQSNTVFHKMPIEIKIHFSTGVDTLIRVMNDVNEQVYIFNFNRQPLTVTFDPDREIVLKQATLTIIPPIPVELTSFTATVTQNSVSLNWQTATETNNSGFEIERGQMSKVKGQSEWQVVGFIPGFGTTTEPKSYSYVDENLSAGKYQYRLKQIDFDGTFEYFPNAFGVEVVITSPTEFSLEQNYPNPFNPSTNIRYTISSRQFVTLKIFNSLGEEIETLVNEFQEAGVHSKLYILNSTLPSGVYYYQLRSGSFVETKKMILLR